MASPYSVTGQVFPGSTSWSLPEWTVLQSFLEAKNFAEEERKADAERRLDAYEDDWRDILRDRIYQAFKKENAEEICKVLDTTNNPIKRIVNEVSTMYSRAPVWRFADESAGPIWREIQEGANADVVMPEVNRLTNLSNTTLLYICPNGGRLSYRPVLPQHTTVWRDPNDPARPLAVAFQEANANTPGAAPQHHFWSRIDGKEVYRLYDTNKRLVREDKNPYANEYGEPAIPLVAYHRKWPTWSFWDQTSGDDIYELTIMLGMWETWTNHLIRTDATRQKWASGLLDATGEQLGGPTSLLSLRSPDGQPVNVGEFSSQSDWGGLGAQITRKLENVLNNYGLALSDFRTSGDPTSGFALRVRKEGLVELRERQIPLYRTWDRALYSTVAAVWNFEITNPLSKVQGEPLPWPSVAKPDIRYASFQVAQTVEERAMEFELQKSRMALGLESPLTIYLYEHPGETEEEAREAILKNLADKESLVPKSAPADPAEPPVVPMPDGKTDEEPQGS